MTQWEGINVFESACYPDGSYATVHGYEGENWRLLIVGNDTDVRNRKLVGNKSDFYEWVAKVDDRLPTVAKAFSGMSPNMMRLRVCTHSSVEEVINAMGGAFGHWDVYNNYPGRNRHVEIEREEDVYLVPNPDFVTGTNWQQRAEDWGGGSEKNERA